MSALATADALQAAYAAGFRGEQLVTAVAVARAESGLRADAVGDGGRSIGLWQVHLPSHPSYSRDALTDPVYAARAAYDISGGGTNWQPWTVYRTGAYTAYLPTVAEQAGSLGLLADAELVDWWDRLNPWKPYKDPDAALIPTPDVKLPSVTGWVGDLLEGLLPILVATVFSVGALGLIALGVMRLTGTSPRKVLDTAGAAAGPAGLAIRAAL